MINIAIAAAPRARFTYLYPLFKPALRAGAIMSGQAMPRAPAAERSA